MQCIFTSPMRATEYLAHALTAPCNLSKSVWSTQKSYSTSPPTFGSTHTRPIGTPTSLDVELLHRPDNSYTEEGVKDEPFLLFLE